MFAGLVLPDTVDLKQPLVEDGEESVPVIRCLIWERVVLAKGIKFHQTQLFSNTSAMGGGPREPRSCCSECLALWGLWWVPFTIHSFQVRFPVFRSCPPNIEHPLNGPKYVFFSPNHGFWWVFFILGEDVVIWCLIIFSLLEGADLKFQRNPNDA